MFRLALMAAVVVMAGCGGKPKPPPPPPPPPLNAIVHSDPATFVDGGAIPADSIEMRSLHCGWQPGSYVVSAMLPDTGRLPVSELQEVLPEVRGRKVWCVSTVWVAGTQGVRSNEVFFHCDAGAGPLRCWRTQ